MLLLLLLLLLLWRWSLSSGSELYIDSLLHLAAPRSVFFLSLVHREDW